MWLRIVYVRVACTRESHPPRSCPSEVCQPELLTRVKLLIFLPLSLHSLLAAENQAFFRTFVIASIAGVYSLFPLLFTPAGKLVCTPYCLLLLMNFRNPN